MMRATVYLAARYGRRMELSDYADTLLSEGYTVTSRWLSGKHEPKDGRELATPAERARWAKEDWADVMRADCVISFTEEEGSRYSRGGRHVEFGAALAMNKKCIIIGPQENVFHCLPEVEHFDTWQDFLAAYFPARKIA